MESTNLSSTKPFNEEGVTNSFLDQLLKRVCSDTFYGGIFASNEFKEEHVKTKRRKGYIVNLNPRHKPSGGHFICIIVEKTHLLYLDPVGLPCLVRNLSSVMETSQKPVLFNKLQIQDVRSKACGLFSAMFLLYFSKTGRRFSMEFDTENRLKNDQTCVNYLKRMVDKDLVPFYKIFTT